MFFCEICRYFLLFVFVASGRVLFVGIFFEYLVEVKGSGRIKVLVNEVGQYKEVVGFDCPSVWKCL